MWQTLRRLLKPLLTALGAVLIVLAISIGAFRLLVTQLPSYQGEIQAWASEALGLSVDFTGLDARLGLLGPELTFHDASVSRVGDESNPILSATRARLGLNALSLFTDRQLEASQLTLEGTRLSLERTLDGRLRLQHALNDDSDTAFGLEDLPSVVIVLTDSNVTYEDRIRGTAWEFQDVRVELTRTVENVLLEARASAPEQLGGRIAVSAEVSLLNQQNDDQRDWGLFTEIRDLDLATLPSFIPQPVQMPIAGVGDLSVWLDGTGVQANQGTMQLAFAGLRVRGIDGEDDGYDNIELTAEWSRLDEGWTLSLNNLDVARDGRLWPSGTSLDMSVLQNGAGSRVLELRTDFIRLEDLSPLVPMLPDIEMTRRWVELAPRGELTEVDLRLARGPGASWDYSAAGSFSQVGVLPTGEWPGITSLTGEVRADTRSGRLALTTRGTRIDWPTVFPEFLEATELDGILVWRQGRDGLRVVSDDLILSNDDVTTRTTLELTYPMDDTSPVLELASSFSDFNVGAMGRYLPAGIMVPGAFRYLDRAIVGGRVSRADVSFFGPVRAFPFDEGEGQFEAHVQIEDGSMAFAEGWPEALGITGTIDFLNAGYVARGSARVLGHQSENLTVAIGDMRDPVLTVETQTTGPLEDVFRFLNEAPLIARHLGPDFARLEARGGIVNVTLDLGLPLLDRSAYNLNAALEVVDGEIAVEGFGPSASNIHGILSLEEESVSGVGIEATLLDGPVTVSVGLPEEPGYVANVAFDGEINVEAVETNFDLPLEGRLLGQTRWQGSVLLPATTLTQVRREPLRISVGSNLFGVALRLPEPLTKSPYEPTNFRLDFVFSESDRLDVSGQVGAARRFALSFRNREGELSFRRGNVRFGGDYPLLPPRDGLTINGTLGELGLEEWWDFFRGEVSGGAFSDVLLGSNLEIADLSAFGQSLGQTNVALRQDPAQWRLDVESDPVAGTITLPLNSVGRPQVVAEMQRLNISTENVAAATEWDPRDLPSVLLEAEQFGVGQRHFGTLNADIQADPLGLRLASFQTQAESFSIEGSGGWFDGGQGPTTRLALTLDSYDVATTLEQLGLDPITEAVAGDVTLSVSWPDTPSADWTKSISGALTLRLERGSFLNLEPGAGRMMGLMSITALPRRLALDFRDVFNRGMVFDEVSGDFLLIDGDAYTDNLLLTGPVADIGVVGRTGLRDQDYQQQAVVTAEPGKILPTMGFLTGPQVGAALLIFTQIFKEPLKGIGRASYCVTGNWYEPSVDRLTPAELQGEALCADLPPGSNVVQ